jgi:hypothetical protein
LATAMRDDHKFVAGQQSTDASGEPVVIGFEP